MQFEQLQKELVSAMKLRDKVRKETVSSLVSAVKKLAIDEGSRDDIKEELVTRAILKELKIVKEQMDTCPDERAELKAEYKARYDIISGLAPSMMSEDEVKSFIIEKFPDLVEAGNKGQIMKNVMPELKGKADGKVINQVVGELCK
jgi:uncharacterized protein YqeY